MNDTLEQQTTVKILRATHLGMCFGVRDAIALAQTAAQRHPVTVLGELVHNEDVLADLRARGIRFATQPGEPTTDTVLVTAHGTSDRHREELRASRLQVLDATCPLVQHAHRALRKLVEDGFHPVVIGQRNHVEVRGLTGDFAGCDVVLTLDDINSLPSCARFGVISQTTQPMARVRELVQLMRVRFPEAEIQFRDTVCHPTKQRQHAAEELAQHSDVVVVVGGAMSNNTRELVLTCTRFCARVHHVQTTADLRPAWFEGARTIGLTAGTSTPDSTIASVERWLQSLNSTEQLNCIP